MELDVEIKDINGSITHNTYKLSNLSYEYFAKHFRVFPLKTWLKEIFNFYKPKLIIPKDIEKYAKEGLTEDVEPFEFENYRNDNENIYIDNDRIGIELNCDREEEFVLKYFFNKP